MEQNIASGRFTVTRYLSVWSRRLEKRKGVTGGAAEGIAEGATSCNHGDGYRLVMAAAVGSEDATYDYGDDFPQSFVQLGLLGDGRTLSPVAQLELIEAASVYRAPTPRRPGKGEADAAG
eukprot:5408136-Prymnesium_polylepis.1